MKLVIVGAGASAGTVGAPVARNLGTALTTAKWQAQFPQLWRAVMEWEAIAFQAVVVHYLRPS
jgi:hypothetical protein